MANKDEWGGVEVAEPEQDEFGGVAIDGADEFGGIPIDEPSPRNEFDPGLSPEAFNQIRQHANLESGGRAMGAGNDDFIRAVANDPKGIPGAIAQTALAPFSMAGKFLNAALQDAMTTVAGDPESGGNLYELTAPNHQLDTKLPLQRTLEEISASNPAIATTGKIASGITESLPMLAVMPQGAIGKLLAAGFTADMIANAGDAATRLGEEMGKPEAERDQDKITTAISDIAQSAAFAPLTGAHAGGKAIGERVAPRREAIRELATELSKEPISPDRGGARPVNRLVLTLDQGENVLGRPDIAQLADRALQEGPNPVLDRGEVSALERIRQELNPPQIEAVEPKRVAERIEGGGEAPYGRTSFQRTAEAPTTERTQAARAQPDPIEGSLKIGESKAPEPGSTSAEQLMQMPAEQANKFFDDIRASGNATQNDAVLHGMKLGEQDVPRLQEMEKGLREQAQKAVQSGDSAGFKAAYGKMVWLNGAIEGALRKGPNFDTLQKRQALRVNTNEINQSIPLKDTAAEVTKFEMEFPGAPKINIAPDFSAMPKTAQDLAMRVGSDPRLIEAYVRNGEVWINGDAVVSPEMVRRLALHETGGHWAVDAKLGNRLQKFMEQAHDSFADSETMVGIRERYPNADKVTLGRELVAHLAENPTLAPKIWSRIVAQVRQWLRDIGWVKKVSENDIQSLITGAIDGMRKAERGEANNDGMLSLKSAAEAAGERYPNEEGADVSNAGENNKKTSSSKTAQVSTPQVGSAKGQAGAGKASAPGAKSNVATLDDIYKIFEPEKKTSPTIKERGIKIAEAFRTGVSSKFRPVNKLAEDIAKSYGLSKPKDIAGIMEQLKGSQGKAEAEVYRFDRDVSKLVEGSEKDFNAYIFLRRSLDRLNQDAADIAKAQSGGNVQQFNRRSVGRYTINELTPKLQALEASLGPEKLANFEKAANEYQRYTDDALRLQVESGRMSKEVYDAIKEGNQFYAPFKVMKYLEENSKPPGAGKRIDTVADYTKAMKGIESEDFKLGDMLGAARQGIIMSRILADKNMAMRHVAELAPFDVNGTFIKKIAQDADAPKGFEAVNVLENGKQVRYAVKPEVAEAIQLYGPNSQAVGWVVRAISNTFRAGATSFNLPFQVSNLLADIPRQALVSKYGIRTAGDLVRYPLDFIESLYASIQGDVLGRDNKLFLDFLDSGVAGTTVQSMLTPEALKFKEPTSISKSKKLASTVLGTIPKFAQAIEQTSKVLGVKRAMRFEGIESGKELAKQIPEAITELRRFSGSPDFGRQGATIEKYRLNLIYMFLNARIQGAIADIGRLGGRDGASTAAQTWLKIGTAVGIPTAYLYYLNNRPEFKEDYDKRPLQEKQNYWLIPKDSYITNDDGEKMRDYWRVPKREVSKWMANLTESALNFAQKRDPRAATDFGASMIQELSPVNIQGENTQERLESVAASLNPLLKAPLELASGRDLYRHRTIVPDTMKNASPEEQYTPRTAEAFKKLAVAMPDVAPEFLRSPLILENLTRNLTAGLLTQFLPRKPIEGRSGIENNPLLARFQALPYSDNSEFQNEIQKLERNAADEQLARHRQAVKLMDDNKKSSLDKILDQAPKDEKLMRHIIDLYIAKENGVTAQERQLLALPTKQRAAYIANQIQGLSPDKQNEAILEYARKRILTEDVFQQLPEALQK